MVLSSLNTDLFISVFDTSVDCDIRDGDTIELKNILYIGARVTGTINFRVKETWMLRSKI